MPAPTLTENMIDVLFLSEIHAELISLAHDLMNDDITKEAAAKLILQQMIILSQDIEARCQKELENEQAA